MDVAQSEFLALLLEESLSALQPAASRHSGSDGVGVVTWQSHDLISKQQPVPVEGGAMVGCQRERVESTQELTANPMSFLNSTDVTKTTNTNAVDTVNNIDTDGSLFDSVLDTAFESSAKEVGTGTETPLNSPRPSFPLVTSCDIASFDVSSVTEDFFEADLDKLLHPFAESILNPTDDDFDTWDIESMLTTS